MNPEFDFSAYCIEAKVRLDALRAFGIYPVMVAVLPTTYDALSAGLEAQDIYMPLDGSISLDGVIVSIITETQH